VARVDANAHFAYPDINFLRLVAAAKIDSSSLPGLSEHGAFHVCGLHQSSSCLVTRAPVLNSSPPSNKSKVQPECIAKRSRLLMRSLQRLDSQQVSHDSSRFMLRNDVVPFQFALDSSY